MFEHFGNEIWLLSHTIAICLNARLFNERLSKGKKHFAKKHRNETFPESLKISQQELKECDEFLREMIKKKQKKPKHGPGYDLLIPYKGKNNGFNEAKLKASNKFSSKPISRKRKFDSIQKTEAQNPKKNAIISKQ
ncbi:MAG: hypothetical protein GY928_08265 [Colwellia sp.]|nr:hypothetical protein [Colwellia sp.]